jgi:hypothetical protein
LSSGVTKPLAQTLFWVSLPSFGGLLYTTREAWRSIYLPGSRSSPRWMQLALVIVAWLFRRQRAKKTRRSTGSLCHHRGRLDRFSYVSLNTWFAERERPAMAQRTLYDELNSVAPRTCEKGRCSPVP